MAVRYTIVLRPQLALGQSKVEPLGDAPYGAALWFVAVVQRKRAESARFG